MKTSTFQKIIEYGIQEIWLKMGGGKNSSQVLIGQFSNYKIKKLHNMIINLLMKYI